MRLCPAEGLIGHFAGREGEGENLSEGARLKKISDLKLEISDGNRMGYILALRKGG